MSGQLNSENNFVSKKGVVARQQPNKSVALSGWTLHLTVSFSFSAWPFPRSVALVVSKGKPMDTSSPMHQGQRSGLQPPTGKVNRAERAQRGFLASQRFVPLTLARRGWTEGLYVHRIDARTHRCGSPDIL